MSDYAQLPIPDDADGAPRSVGVEIEFGGISVADAVSIAKKRFGGEIERKSQHLQVLHVEDRGEFEFELDMAPRHVDAFAEREGDDDPVRAITGEVVNWLAPVELVAPPISADQLPELHGLIEGLRDAGATGASHGMQTAYGMHLNIAAPSLDVEGLLPITRAFALLEDWLRETLQISTNRRLTGFVKPYPRDYLDHLARDENAPDLKKFLKDYLHFNPTRNRALDLTPIIEMLDSDLAAEVLGDEKRSARPTFHYRLPDAHVDKQAWTPRRDWMLWRVIERAAMDPAVTMALTKGWREHRATWTSSRGDWVHRCTDMLRAAGLIDSNGEPTE